MKCRAANETTRWRVQEPREREGLPQQSPLLPLQGQPEEQNQSPLLLRQSPLLRSGERKVQQVPPTQLGAGVFSLA